jgi:hypothetical protein
MNEEYAELSLYCGLFAAAADWHLGYQHFMPRIRAQSWELTIDKLAAWKNEALSLGVPSEVIEPSEYLVKMMPELRRVAQKMQDRVDEAHAQ